MTMNNFDIIAPLLKFESEDDFYYLQILQRKKDQNDEYKGLKSNNNARTIKNYYISSLEYLESKMPEIIKLCEVFNARASIRLNKRSYRKVAFKTLQKIADTMANGEYSHIINSYSKACGVEHNAGNNKVWILDIDEPIGMLALREHLESLAPLGDKYIAFIPSPNGGHIISKPFDISKFDNAKYKIDIHKDNPTNLYIP